MEELLRTQADGGHDVAIIVPRVEGLVEGDRAGVHVVGARYAPAPLQRWGYGRSLGLTNRLRPVALIMTPFALGSIALWVRRLIRDMDPDVVHIHWILPLGILSLLVPKSIPVVISAHGADSRFFSGALKPLAAASARRANAVVAASSQILELLAEVQPSIKAKSHVIPHGANAEVFAPMSKREAKEAVGVDPQTRLVLGVGRLVGKKGFLPLIQSMSLLADTNASLYIVGEGPERRVLESLILETDARAKLVGAQPRELVATWMAASDVVVVPGVADRDDVDSGPVVLMEALAMGRPVVASRVGMAPDVIEDDVNGYLLSSTTPESIASAVRDAILDTTRLGDGARKTFASVGDWDRVARQLEMLYESALSAKDRPA